MGDGQSVMSSLQIEDYNEELTRLCRIYDRLRLIPPLPQSQYPPMGSSALLAAGYIGSWMRSN